MIFEEKGKYITYSGDSMQFLLEISNLDAGKTYDCFFQINYANPIQKKVQITADDNGEAVADIYISPEENSVKVGQYNFATKIMYENVVVYQDTLYSGVLDVRRQRVEVEEDDDNGQE